MFRSKSEAERPAPRAAPGTVGSASASGSAVPPEIASRIHRVGATEMDVDRGAIDDMIARHDELFHAVRLVPIRENGQTVEIAVDGVKPGTLLDLLGLAAGDRVRTINGLDVTSPELALHALGALRAADHLSVRLNRGGRDTVLDFNVRP